MILFLPAGSTLLGDFTRTAVDRWDVHCCAQRVGQVHSIHPTEADAIRAVVAHLADEHGVTSIGTLTVFDVVSIDLDTDDEPAYLYTERTVPVDITTVTAP